MSGTIDSRKDTGSRAAHAYRAIWQRIFELDRVEVTYDEHARDLTALERRRTGDAQRLLRAHIEQSKIEVRKSTLDMLYQARSHPRLARQR